MSRIRKNILIVLCIFALTLTLSIPCLAKGAELTFENCNTVLVTAYYIVGIREDGTLRLQETYEGYDDSAVMEAAAELEDVVSLRETSEGFAALMADGSVAEICYYRDEHLRYYDWTGVEEIVSTGYAVLGRRYDGTVYVSEPREEFEEEYFAHLDAVREWKNVKSLSTVRLDWHDGPVFAFGEDGEFYYTEWRDLIMAEKYGLEDGSLYEDFHEAMACVNSEDDILVGTNILVVGNPAKPQNCYVFYPSPYGGYEYDAYTSVTRSQLAALKKKPVDILANRGDIMFLLEDGTVTHCLNAEMAAFTLYPDGSRNWYEDPVNELVQYPEDVLEAYAHADTADLKNVVAMSSFAGATDTEPFVIYHLKDGTLVARGNWLPDLTLEDWTDIRLPGTAMDGRLAADTVTFGSYQGEDIEWIVLDEQDGKQLLISKNCIACRSYHDEYAYITWDRCELRDWLNGEFFESAFTSAEQERISTTNLRTKYNKVYYVSAGMDTRDRVFILSAEEASSYFEEGERWASPGKVARAEAAANDAPAYEWYWLRTPGQNAHYVASVNADGGIAWGGYNNAQYGYVRPAIWIEK